MQKAKLDGQCLVVKETQLNATNRFVGPTTGKLLIEMDGEDVEEVIL